MLGKLKSGAGSPTFRFVCGAGGGVAGLFGAALCVGADWAAAAVTIEASKKIKPRTFFIIAVDSFLSISCLLPSASRLNQISEARGVYLRSAAAAKDFCAKSPISVSFLLIAIKPQEFLKWGTDNEVTLNLAGSERRNPRTAKNSGNEQK